MRADRQRRLRVHHWPARLLTPVGAVPMVVSPQAGHTFATTWYSVTVVGGAGLHPCGGLVVKGRA
jgi:hypothetical protein